MCYSKWRTGFHTQSADFFGNFKLSSSDDEARSVLNLKCFTRKIDNLGVDHYSLRVRSSSCLCNEFALFCCLYSHKQCKCNSRLCSVWRPMWVMCFRWVFWSYFFDPLVALQFVDSENRCWRFFWLLSCIFVFKCALNFSLSLKFALMMCWR